MAEWKEHFMRLLGGVKDRVVKGGRERSQEGEGSEEEISKEEVRRVLKKLREGKAAGVDGIPREVWKHGGAEELEEWVIMPIVKKGERERVEDYRVTLLSTLYKVYVAVLAERLREEVECKGIIPSNQTGFRKGMGTVDNIYVLNYLVNRQLGRKGGKVVALFVDLKAAFESVDREVLIEALRERGVSEGLVERIEEMLRETKGRVRIGKELGESFWTAKGIRQRERVPLAHGAIAHQPEKTKKIDTIPDSAPAR